MKSLPKLIRRFVGIMLLSSVLIIALNVTILAVLAADQSANAHPWTTAKEAADALRQTEDGGYILPDEFALELENSNVWAVFIDNGTGKVVWHTDSLPETVPASYTIADIAGLTRGYMDGYPTFTGEAENGLVVLGYPKDSFWKHMWPSWDYDLIANLPKIALTILAINITLIFIIYAAANSKLLKSVKPIVSGIQALPEGEAVFVKEAGLLSELAVNINKTSDILQAQSRQLRKKETARANWIAGISHDIRTPLSMVMGYAGQLKDDSALSDENRQKAAVIVKQSERMKNLINDLNLASKLEYDMQPVNSRVENLVSIVRQAAVDFMNMDIDGKYPIEWETDEALTFCPVNADKELLKRAVGNLIQNCINHNEQGCKIHAAVRAGNKNCCIEISDEGVGAEDGQIEKLNNAPHYMLCDEKTTEQCHGLGLLIVKQIIAAHGGMTEISRSVYGGFSVKLILPAAK